MATRAFAFLASALLLVSCGSSPTAPHAPAAAASSGGCQYNVIVSPSTVPATGGEVGAWVTTGESCPWVAFTVDPFNGGSNFSITPPSGTGNAMMRIVISPYTGVQPRTLQLKIAGISVGIVQLAAPAPVPGPNAYLLFFGTPDDPVTLGQAGLVTSDQFNIAVTPYSRRSISLLYLSSRPGSNTYSLSFEAPVGQVLTIGSYENARRFQFEAPGSPGLDFIIYGGGEGCDTLTGQFEILDIAFDATDRVTRLHATFLQHCEGAASSASGEVWYPVKSAVSASNATVFRR